MSTAHPAGVVVDTMVISWFFEGRSDPRSTAYRELAGESPVVLSFQTVLELRYGALRAGWGELRVRRLERRISQLAIVQPDDAMITVCAQLRNDCRKAGHPLAAKVHDGDRWIAATAIRLGLPLLSDDNVFKDAPKLALITGG